MTYTISDVPIEHHPDVVYKIYTVQCSVHRAVCSAQCTLYTRPKQ